MQYLNGTVYGTGTVSGYRYGTGADHGTKGLPLYNNGVHSTPPLREAYHLFVYNGRRHGHKCCLNTHVRYNGIKGLRSAGSEEALLLGKGKTFYIVGGKVQITWTPLSSERYISQTAWNLAF